MGFISKSGRWALNRLGYGSKWAKHGSKWHPASGKWGIFGETKGSQIAGKTRSFLDEQKDKIEGRRDELGEFFATTKDMTEETALTEFLKDSYSIDTESEAKKGKTNLATVFDDTAERTKEALQDSSKYKLDMQLLNLGRQEQDTEYALDYLIRQLDLEKLRV